MTKTTKATASGLKLVRSKGKRAFAGSPNGWEPRPSFFDYKDTATLRKFLTNQGKLMGRKRSGLSAASQRALAQAVKRARVMALLPYTGE